jgi:hypothetical protein
MYGKMKKAKYLGLGLAMFCLISLVAVPAFAQDNGFGGSVGESGSRAGTAGATELMVPLTARSTALGGATTSGMMGMSGLEALYSNPAGLSLAQSTSVMFSRVEYVADIGVNYIALAQPVGSASTIALTMTAWDFGDIPVQTEASPEISDVHFNVSYITAGATYARQLTDRIAAGATLKIVSEKIDDISASTLAFDAGMTYVVGESGLRLGVALKNVGNELQFGGNGLIRRVRVPGQEPTAKANALQVESEGVQLPTLLNFGIAYARNLGAASTVTLLSNFRSNSFDQDQYAFALEYGFQNLLYLRAGYQATEDMDKTFYQGASYGAGVNLDFGGTSNLTIDYSIVPTDFFDNVQYITATVTL